MTLTVGSLFAGIGGFDLGLERAGMKVIWQSEIDPYASAVLRKHWPNTPNYGDVRNIRAGIVQPPDVLCGGFPCQDISNAGKKVGIGGLQSGLWSEFARCIRDLRPKYVAVENVAALLTRGMDTVLGDLAALGFDAEWHCIPASAIGAPHCRDRAWIIAYPKRDKQSRAKQRDGTLGRMGWLRQSLAWNRNWKDALCKFRGMDDGLSYGVDRTDTIRNALVPQIAQVIGDAILKHHHTDGCLYPKCPCTYHVCASRITASSRA